ncbi:hypothetical protein, partial [Burkholderia sp. Ac-20353]|uniref:hypothetical protein n=1 Tax=Burkholderia sp. Ac-20353 TaxID=2703894 RepID=UPI00197B4DFC
YRLSFFNNLEEVSNLDSGSVYEMDVETIRVVIVSMYLKMIRTLCLTQLEYGTTRELKPVTRQTRYRVKRTSACGGCLGDHRR